MHIGLVPSRYRQTHCEQNAMGLHSNDLLLHAVQMTVGLADTLDVLVLLEFILGLISAPVQCLFSH